MGILSVSFSIDQNQHLAAVVPANQIPSGSNTLDVENGLPPGQSQSFPNFIGSADLGMASTGVYLVTLTLNGTDTCAAVVSISGLPGALSVISGIAVPATGGAFGFDTDGTVPDGTLTILKSNFEYIFCLRYVSRAAPYTKDISSTEVGTYLAEDVALMLVQHPPAAGWTPTADEGTSWGTAAVANAATACVPKGVSLFCDLEGVDSDASASDIADFCNGWYSAVSNAGYSPGLYVGANCGLSSDQLSALSFQTFWKSCSTVPAPQQGFVMTQSPCDVERGDENVTIQVDENTIANSAGSLMWLKKQVDLQ